MSLEDLCSEFENLTLRSQIDDDTSTNLSKVKKRLYNKLVTTAKEFEKNNQFQTSLDLYQKAFVLFNIDEKLKAKIRKLSKILEADNTQPSTALKNKESNSSKDLSKKNSREPLKQVPIHNSNSSLNSDLCNNRIKGNDSLPLKNIVKIAKSNVAPPSSSDPFTKQSEKRYTSISLSNSVPDEDGFLFDESTKHFVLRIAGCEEKPYKISKDVYEQIYPYQRKCLRWLWEKHIDTSLCKHGGGGILGDDMGLGKTVQICGFISGLFSTEYSKMKKKDPYPYVLIVMPVSVIENWKREYLKWVWNKTCKSQNIRPPLYVFHGINTKKQRESIMREFAKTGGCMITSYGMITSQVTLFTADDLFDETGRVIEFEYVILDEGHKIKNPTIKISVNLRMIRSKHRIILSGTPIQNNLSELWALYDYIFEGKLLGDQRTFRKEFESKIIRAREKDASQFEKRLGDEMSKRLKQVIGPYFLRREKNEVLNQMNLNTATSEGISNTNSASKQFISKKNDFIVWVILSEKQIELYHKFLQSPEVRSVLNKSSSALAALTILKQICNHPYLIPSHHELSTSPGSSLIDQGNLVSIMEQSGKLVFLRVLLHQLFTEEADRKHKVLIFSQSAKMLDIISLLLDHEGYKFLRIDGSINDTQVRQRYIDQFNQDPSYQCFILTSQTGGLGITLTAADRIVVMDPAWNPATDNQAVDRAYRIGQKRNVIVYRLITCGTIEEKIYKKQVFKGLLSKTAIDKSSATSSRRKSRFEDFSYKRYFTHQELRQLFSFSSPYQSDTQIQLQQIIQEHLQGRSRTYPELEQHKSELLQRTKLSNKHHRKGLVFGLSEHDIVFEAKENETENDNDLIQTANLKADEICKRLFSPSSNNRGPRVIEIDESEHSLSSNPFTISEDFEEIRKKKKQLSRTKEAPLELSSCIDLEEFPGFSLDEITNLFKGVRMFGEQDEWRKISKEFNLMKDATSIQQTWMKIKKNRTLPQIKKLLESVEEELKQKYTHLPSLPRIRPTTISLESLNAKNTNQVVSNSDHTEVIKQIPKEKVVLSDHNCTPPSETTIMIDDSDDDDNDGHDDISKTNHINECEQDIQRKPKMADAEGKQLMTPTTETSDPTSEDEENEETLDDVSRRLSLCFGLIEKQDDQDLQNESADSGYESDSVVDNCHKNINTKEEDHGIIPSAGGRQKDSQRKIHRKNVIYDSEESEDDDGTTEGSCHHSNESDSPIEKRPNVERLTKSMASLNISRPLFEEDELGTSEETIGDFTTTQEQQHSSPTNQHISAHENLSNQSGVECTDQETMTKTLFQQFISEGILAQQRGEYEIALEYYMKALELNDDDVKLHCSICFLGRQLGFY